MKNNVENIFAEMRRERVSSVNEEEIKVTESEVKKQVNEEDVEQIEDSSNEEDLTKVPEKKSNLEINKKATNGRAFTVEINGKKYSYYPTEESGLTAKELGEKYTKIAQYSKGRALSWLKKNATTPDSYRKKKEEVVEEESVETNNEVNEEVRITIDAADILKAATAIEKAESEGKTATVVQTSEGLKVETSEAEDKNDKDPDGKEESPEGEEPEEEKKEESCDKDEETCPVCGKKHKKGEKCCEEETSDKETVNEEVDVAELAVRLDECQGSDYMKKALEEGKYDIVKKYLYLKEE